MILLFLEDTCETITLSIQGLFTGTGAAWSKSKMGDILPGVGGHSHQFS